MDSARPGGWPRWANKLPRSERGVVLFRSDWLRSPSPSPARTRALCEWRQRLHEAGLIGVNAEGVGFGNLSQRCGDSSRFLISGTGTGRLSRLGPQHFTEVTGYRFEDNFLSCSGPCQASSESLTHAAVYQTAPMVKAVIHVHHGELWQRLRGRIPTTDSSAEAGTPEMAFAIEKLFKKGMSREKGLFVMGGHEDGLMAYGSDLSSAALEIFQRGLIQ